MKPLTAPARPLVERPPAPPLKRVPRPTPSQLRRDRDRLFKEGKFDRAIRVAEQLARLQPSREALFRLGVILRDGGRLRRSLKAFRDALRFKEGPAYLVPEVHFHLAYAWYRLGEYKRMGESLRRAYAFRLKPRSEANLHITFGNYYLSYRKYREAHAEFVQAEPAARDSLTRGRAVVNQGVALYYQRELGEADRLLGRAIRIFENGGHAADLANARAIRGTFYLDRGQFLRALSIASRAAESFERLENLNKTAESLHGAGYAALELGRWKEACENLDRAITLATQTGHRDALITSHACRAIAAARIEQFDRASADLAEARRHLKGYRYWIGSLHVYRAQARIAELFGNWAEVRRWAGRAERLACRVDDVVRIAEFRRQRARAEAELGRRRAEIHARKGASTLETLLGSPSRTNGATAALTSRLARSRIPVLVVGESGVGKTAVAREIHRRGPRSGKPCVVVPCEQLVFAGSEVAGHEEGAWSGARERSIGYARRAAGGTLILDRLDELSAEEQRVLVPVVEGRVRSVGSAQEQRIDVRVIAVVQSARRILPKLRARLAGATIPVPALRERPDDILSLVRSLLGGRPITADALALLAAQRWEGNYPEIKARVQQLIALAGGPIGLRAVRQVLKTPDRRRHAARVADLRRMAQTLK